MAMTIPEDLSSEIEEDFVKERKSTPSFTQDMLRLSLTVSKYMCILDGVGYLTSESYLKSKGLVMDMIERNKKRSVPNK